LVRRNVVVASAVLALASLAEDASSETSQACLYGGPRGPLTAAERLSYQVASAPAICHARIVRMVDTVVVDPLALRPHRSRHRFLVFEPIRWLKGEARRRIEIVGRIIDSPALFERLRTTRHRGEVLLFLQDFPAGRSDYSIDPKWPYPRKARWMLTDRALTPDELLLDRGSSHAAVERVRAEIAAQTLTGLVRSSQAVVVAHPEGTPGTTMDGRIFRRVAVDSVLAGRLPERSIEVGTYVGELHSDAAAVLFLVRDAQGHWMLSKPMVAAAGVSTKHGMVRSFAMSLPQIAREIRRVDSVERRRQR
jgi:hypothetical protein